MIASLSVFVSLPLPGAGDIGLPELIILSEVSGASGAGDGVAVGAGGSAAAKAPAIGSEFFASRLLWPWVIS